MIAEIEESILQRLQLLNDGGLRIAGFPDNPQESGRSMPNGQVLVGYKKESLEPPNTFIEDTPVIQKWTLEYEISVQLKNLRSHTGAYPVMDEIKELLTGFRPSPINQPLYQIQGGFVDMKDGIWYYSMIFGVRTNYIKKV
jgi:hypothetical protein